MKICAAQTKPIKGDFKANIENHLGLIEKASQENADLVIFPELSISGYEPSLARELGTNIEDKRFDIFQRESNEKDIVIGIGAPLLGSEGIHIGMVLFQPHQERRAYLKKHLHHTEEPFFVSGKSASNIHIKNNNIGLAICYELSVPDHQQHAHKNGADIYFASVVETVDGIEKAINKMSNTANKYQMTTLIANCIGTTGEYKCGGKSSVWDENGILMGQLDSSSEGLIVYNTESKEVQTILN